LKCRLQQNLNLLTHWQVNGAHYGLTSEAWLQNMDKNEKELLPILGDICAIAVLCCSVTVL
jgi:cyclopropane-fatty-acyl-phospholipid synthase